MTETRKIVAYEIANTKDVRKYIEDGWQPLGGPFVRKVVSPDDFNDTAYSVFQDMVKYEVLPTPPIIFAY